MDHLCVRWFHIRISLNPHHTLTGMHDIISLNRGGYADSKGGSNRYRATLWIMEKLTYYEDCLPIRVVFTPKCLPPLRAVIASPPMCPDRAPHHTQPRCSPGKRGWLPCLATRPGPVSSDKSWTSCRRKSLTSLMCSWARDSSSVSTAKRWDEIVCLVGLLLWGPKEMAFEKQNFWQLGKEWVDSEKFASFRLLLLGMQPDILNLSLIMRLGGLNDKFSMKMSDLQYQ